MVKKYSLSKKLASYSALAVAVLAVSHEADAQIIYTNLNSGVMIPNPIPPLERNVPQDTSYYLDLNNDGTVDFQFTAFRERIAYYTSGTYNSNATGFSASSRNTVISVNGLHKDSVNSVGAYSGSLIPSNNANSWTPGAILAQEFTWFYSGRYSSGSSSKSGGNFLGVTDKFLPLKLKNNGDTYYGWARLTTNAANQLTIADYAYNSIPDSAIISGNTGCNFAPITPVVTEKGDTLHSTGANKYQWFFDGTPVPGDTLPVATPSQQGYYAVLTTDGNGCLSKSQAKYFSCYSVQPDVSESSGFSNPSCVPIQLLADNLVNGTFIQWLKNGATITDSITPTYLADSSGSYSAEFIDSSKTCYLISNTVQLTINQIPIPDPVVSTGNQSTVLCQGAVFNISLTDSSDYNQQAYTLQWYVNGTAILGANKPLYSIDTSGAYFLSVTNGACYKYSDTLQLTIIQIPDPVVSTNNQSTVLCQGGVFNISLTDSSDYNKTDTLQWYLNGISILGADKPLYSIDTSGTYFLSITSGTCYKYSDTLIITEDIQHPTINPVGKDTLMTQHYTSYQWYKDGVQASDGTGQYYTATDSGTYYVIVIDSLGCSFKSSDYYFIGTGIASSIQPDQISIYSYGKTLHILLTDENILGSMLRIYNILGQQVFSTTLSTEQTQIDMNDFVSGSYIVEVEGKKSPVIKKIVIE